MKLFTIAGISCRNGQTKYRFATDMARIKTLVKTGHTEIQLFELPTAMDKDGAVLWLKTEKGLVLADTGNDDEPAQPKSPRAKKEKQAALPAEAAQEPDEDGFVEPTDERIQVAMAKKAREYPGLKPQALLDMVMLTHKEFGDYEPTF